MISALELTCWISLFYSAYSICVQLPNYVAEGEPAFICCPKGEPNDTVTWYRNGIPINKDMHYRIHQGRNLLWFYPAIMEDSGVYECHNHESDKGSNALYVFQNTEGLCYNGNMTYPQHLFLHENGKLKCPDLYEFKTKNTTLTLQWFKDCQLLQDRRFSILGDDLYVENVTKSDKGIYKCQTTYTYMGKQYRISRDIKLNIHKKAKKGLIEIIYPNNNSVEVELGSSVSLNCTASIDAENILFVEWIFKADDNFTNAFTRNSTPEKEVEIHTFNITEVKPEDYRKYMCMVSGYGTRRYTYLTLKPPARNIQCYLIGGLVSPLFVILSVLVIYKFFKVDIVLWYRESFPYFLSKRVSDGKVYDAYVLYPRNIANCTHLSDIFVMKVLPEVLEKKCGYKLFIFGRDDLPGQALLSVTDETIKQSRRVILILAPDSSSFGTLGLTSEHELAVYSALIRDGIKVILIEVDKTKDDDCVPESIKYLKQKHGVLTWKGDVSESSQVERTKFWKNVRYQMPARQSRSSADFYILPP